MAETRIIGTNSFPVIHVRGTNYQVGFETGRLMKEHIQASYAGNSSLHQEFLPFIKTEKGKAIYDGYRQVVQDTFPQYLDEIRGLSDGSGVPFEQVFVMHLQSEIAVILQQGELLREACSTVFVNCNSTEVLGHNEDGDAGARQLSYLISAEIQTDHGTVKEQFTAFAYPGTLPGPAFGFNRAGVILTMNALSPTTVPTGKIPLDIVLRALLSAENRVDFERILHTPPGISLGCSLNAIFTWDPNEPRKMRNYEILGSLDPAVHAVVDEAEAHPYDASKPDTEGNGYLHHFNKYERIQVEQIPKNIVSSVHRQNRATKLPTPKTTADALALLGDTQNVDYPLYRTPNGKDTGCTIATALFDLKAMTMSVYRDNPKVSAPLLTLSIPKFR